MKTFFKIVGWIAIAAVATGIIIAGVKIYNAHYDMSEYYYDEYVNDKLEVHENYEKERHALYNNETQAYTIRNIDWVSKIPNDEGYAVFSRRNKRGFFDPNSGKIAIKEQYTHAWVFAEGVAAVMKGDSLGFINAANEVVIPFQYVITDTDNFDCVFHDGYCIMKSEDGKYGFIDKSGKWVVEPIYESIEASKDYYYVVFADNRYGLLDSKLNTIYPVEYQYIRESYNKPYIYIAKNGIMQCVDYEGKIVQPFVCDFTTHLEYYPDDCTSDYSSQLVSNYIKYNFGNYYGVMRRDNGQVIIPAIYNNIRMVSRTLFKVSINDVYILIDEHGNIVDGE
ncbi:MAG: WG repeat-containing protein [Bacteroidaceae bacterium]|nr:WG repeat-containing protein [Bacteroidaceae bacterium]